MCAKDDNLYLQEVGCFTGLILLLSFLVLVMGKNKNKGKSTRKISGMVPELECDLEMINLDEVESEVPNVRSGALGENETASNVEDTLDNNSNSHGVFAVGIEDENINFCDVEAISSTTEVGKDQNDYGTLEKEVQTDLTKEVMEDLLLSYEKLSQIGSTVTIQGKEDLEEEEEEEPSKENPGTSEEPWMKVENSKRASLKKKKVAKGGKKRSVVKKEEDQKEELKHMDWAEEMNDNDRRNSEAISLKAKNRFSSICDGKNVPTRKARSIVKKACEKWAEMEIKEDPERNKYDLWLEHLKSQVEIAEEKRNSNLFNPGSMKDYIELLERGDFAPPSWTSDSITWDELPSGQKLKIWKMEEYGKKKQAERKRGENIRKMALSKKEVKKERIGISSGDNASAETAQQALIQEKRLPCSKCNGKVYGGHHRPWQCPALGEHAFCMFCRKKGHPFTICPSINCKTCYKVGHSAEVCPNKKDIDKRLSELSGAASKEKIEENYDSLNAASSSKSESESRQLSSSGSSNHLSSFQFRMNATPFVPKSETCSFDESSGVSVGSKDWQTTKERSEPVCGLCCRKECHLNYYTIGAQEYHIPGCQWRTDDAYWKP
jgi:hypothetical protein